MTFYLLIALIVLELLRLLYVARYRPIDIDRVARALLDKAISDYGRTAISERECKQSVRVNYNRLIAEFGLPEGAAQAVERRAWQIANKPQVGDVAITNLY